MGPCGSIYSHAVETIMLDSKNRNSQEPRPETQPQSTAFSCLTQLKCSGCGKEYSHQELHTFCPFCQSPLLSIYDLKSVRDHVDRDEISRRSKGMWRWSELLPVLDKKNQVFLGEGDTPLLSLPRLEAGLGLSNLYVKDESANPTG